MVEVILMNNNQNNNNPKESKLRLVLQEFCPAPACTSVPALLFAAEVWE